jgi:hypothetical protein
MRLLVLWLAVLVACRAFAEAAPSADALISEGVELRRQHKDAEALERFRRAYALQHGPRAQAQMGLAEQALGQWIEADRDLKAALAVADDPWIVRNRAAIDRALATIAEHLGTLELVGSPPGAEVRIDGRVIGRLPLADPLRLPVGSAVVDVSAEQHTPVRRTVVIGAGRLSRERVELVRQAASIDAVLATPAPRGPRPHDRRLWIGGFTLLGVGVAFLGLGAGGVGVYEAAARRWNGDACVGAGLSREEACGAERERAELGERLALSGFVIGGAAAVTGAALLVADAVKRRRPR